MTAITQGALDHIGQNQLPAPNIVATNPANGNSHLFYRLADPICTSDHARLKPMQLLAKIDFVMTEQLEADAGYQGFISRMFYTSIGRCKKSTNTLGTLLIS